MNTIYKRLAVVVLLCGVAIVGTIDYFLDRAERRARDERLAARGRSLALTVQLVVYDIQDSIRSARDAIETLQPGPAAQAALDSIIIRQLEADEHFHMVALVDRDGRLLRRWPTEISTPSRLDPSLAMDEFLGTTDGFGLSRTFLVPDPSGTHVLARLPAAGSHWVVGAFSVSETLTRATETDLAPHYSLCLSDGDGGFVLGRMPEAGAVFTVNELHVGSSRYLLKVWAPDPVLNLPERVALWAMGLITVGLLVHLVWSFGRRELQLEHSNLVLTQRNETIARDLHLASAVQRSGIPRSMENDRVRILVDYTPLEEIGGDYACIVPVEDDRYYLFVGDVSGHGIAAALLTQLLTDSVQRLTNGRKEPVEIIKSLNNFMLHRFSEMGLFLTLSVYLFDFRSQTVLFSGAGHPPTVLIDGRTGRARALRSQCTMLGVLNSQMLAPAQQEIRFEAGDRLVAFTDGLIETRTESGRILGMDRVLEMLDTRGTCTLPELMDNILELRNRSARGRARDDMTLILVEAR